MARSNKVRRLLQRSKDLLAAEPEQIEVKGEAPVILFEALVEVVDENPEGGSDSNGPEQLEMDSESPEGG